MASPPVHPPSQLDRIFATQRASAWRAYLADTRLAVNPRYAEVEPWAWARLQQQLRALDARQRRLQ